MKIKFNLPVSRHNSHLNFDFNSTFDFGDIQSSLSKFVLPRSKFSVSLSQLTRTAPLSVPTFGRMAVHNVFTYVPMSLIYPAFDSFLSQTKISGSKQTYLPSSFPIVTNQSLVCQVLFGSAKFVSFVKSGTPENPTYTRTNDVYLSDVMGVHKFGFGSSSYPPGYTFNDVQQLNWDYIIPCAYNGVNYLTFFKLTDIGRKKYSICRSLGYSLDYCDTEPVSALPLLAYAKACFDIFFPQRQTNWHVTDLYRMILDFYNGDFNTVAINSHYYNYFGYSASYNSPVLYSKFLFTIYSYSQAPVSRNLANVATAQPILPGSTIPVVPTQVITGSDGSAFTPTSPDPSTPIPSIKSGQFDKLTADNLLFLNRLWSFVQRSSVVGQNVKNWFKVHFGVQPTEDMFNSCYVLRDVVNLINVNTVVSTADTEAQGGEQLGSLAGQAYSASSDKVSFEVPNFGYILCLTYVVPVTRISSGTQPELYNCSFYDLPFPDFDGLGYETLNAYSFQEHSCYHFLNDKPVGFGYVPRLSSYKYLNNVRSGGFALPTLKDNYISYCLDSVLTNRIPGDQITSIFNKSSIANASSLAFYFPYTQYADVTGSVLNFSDWRDFNSIFYNTGDVDNVINEVYSPNNFMIQSCFSINLSSYLKPLSDSYEISDLYKNVTSVEKV